MSKELSQLSDLELIDHYIDHCSSFIDPVVFRELNRRGLVWAINHLSGTKSERRSMTRARLAKKGYYVGEEEIEDIASKIRRAEVLRDELTAMNMADAKPALEKVEQLKTFLESILTYYGK